MRGANTPIVPSLRDCFLREYNRAKDTETGERNGPSRKTFQLLEEKREPESGEVVWKRKEG